MMLLAFLNVGYLIIQLIYYLGHDGLFRLAETLCFVILRCYLLVIRMSTQTPAKELIAQPVGGASASASASLRKGMFGVLAICVVVLAGNLHLHVDLVPDP